MSSGPGLKNSINNETETQNYTSPLLANVFAHL